MLDRVKSTKELVGQERVKCSATIRTRALQMTAFSRTIFESHQRPPCHIGGGVAEFSLDNAIINFNSTYLLGGYLSTE